MIGVLVDENVLINFWEIRDPSSNSIRVRYFHLGANNFVRRYKFTFEKDNFEF